MGMGTLTNIPIAYKLTQSNYLSKGSLIDLKDSKLQVIVKLANIHLTPESPEYKGGVWHVEGMQNESIVASGIYYYDNNNISESRLSFRLKSNPSPNPNSNPRPNRNPNSNPHPNSGKPSVNLNTSKTIIMGLRRPLIFMIMTR